MLNGRPRQKPTANQGHRTRGIVDTPVESSYAAYFEPDLDNHPWRSIEVFHLKALQGARRLSRRSPREYAVPGGVPAVAPSGPWLMPSIPMVSSVALDITLTSA